VIVVEECVADKHEIPHFSSLCDLMLKYADVESVDVVRDWLNRQPLVESKTHGHT
jgi:maleamate amidohydrolase